MNGAAINNCLVDVLLLAACKVKAGQGNWFGIDMQVFVVDARPYQHGVVHGCRIDGFLDDGVAAGAVRLYGEDGGEEGGREKEEGGEEE